MADSMSVRFGKGLRRVRKARGMTQEQIERRARLSDHYLSYIENGKKSPTLDTVELIAQGLGLTVVQLIQAALMEEPDNGG